MAHSLDAGIHVDASTAIETLDCQPVPRNLAMDAT
jgi:hypothetical protein